MAYTPFVNPSTRQDLKPNVFSTVGGGTAAQAVISQYDLYKPNELIQVFNRHVDGDGFRIMLKAMGFRRGTSAPTVGHYEWPWRDNLITVGRIVTASTGPGTAVIVELDADDHYDAGVTVNGTGGQRASYPIENEILIFPDGEAAMITNKDTTTNPLLHRLTLTPLQSTTDLATSITAGQAYFVATNAFAEGSDLPAGRVPRIITYNNDFQIIKQKSQATGSSMTNTMYFQPIEGMEGSLYLKVKEDMMYRFEKRCDGALLWGQNINNINVFVPRLGHDAPIRGTEGLLEFATTNGNVDNYTSIGAYTLSDFRDLARYYEAERIGTNSFMNLMGFEIYQEVEQEMSEMLDNDIAALLTKDFFYGDGAFDHLDESEYYKEPAEFALKIGFRAIKIGNHNFIFKSMRDFNARIGAGAQAYNYSSWQIVLPVGFATEKSSNTRMGTFGYEYKQAADGYSREEVWGEITGAGVGGSGYYRPASHGSDVHECFIISEFSFHPTCANHVTIQKPA